MQQQVKDFLEYVSRRNSNEPEFLQAVREVSETVIPFIEQNKKYQNRKLLERMVEPERVIMFRVPWVDDSGEIQINRGFRVQMNSAIGPYKGGLRFQPSVNLSILNSSRSSRTALPAFLWEEGKEARILTQKENPTTRSCASAKAL